MLGPSATGRHWALPSQAIERRAEQLSQVHGIPDLLARVLAMRDVKVEEVPIYLDPKLRDLMPNPSNLTDMDKAAGRLAAAVERGEKVGLFGDYDVDGACSLALLVGWLQELGIDAAYRVPNRRNDGYGPNAKAMAELASYHDLVVVVDCGGAEEADPALAAAVESGADVIVVDHHACPVPPPSPLAVVNPNRADDDSGLEYLSAAGVVFMLLAAANRLLREKGWFVERAEEPLLKTRLDLVALATIADVVPLQGLNRAFVRGGLRVLARRRRPGLAALSDIAGVRRQPDEGTLAWMLAPRLNAPGRIGEDDLLATRLLLAGYASEARDLAQRCEKYNQDRRMQQDEALAQARAQAANCNGDLLVWAAGERWHPGVMGIVAGRLADQKRMPAIVLSCEGKVARGSGRSAPGVDLGAAVRQALREGLLLRGGGHSAAVGLEVSREMLSQAMERIEAILRDSLRDGKLPERVEEVAGTALPGAVSAENALALAQAGPHGQGAPKPKFVLRNMSLAQKQMLRDQHYRLEVSAMSGGSAKAMAFGVVGTPLGDALARAQRGDRVDVMGEITVDDFDGGRRAYLRVDDVILH